MGLDEEILKHQDKASEYEQERRRVISSKASAIRTHNQRLKDLEQLIEAEKEIVTALFEDA